jgi:hypothetical protein
MPPLGNAGENIHMVLSAPDAASIANMKNRVARQWARKGDTLPA